MKKMILLHTTLLIVFAAMFNSLPAQEVSEKARNEITETLKTWNTAAKNAKIDEIMSLFDNSEDIMVVGSDSGEIFKGKVKIQGWLSQLFKHNSFSWEMNRIDIDCNDSTAWVFVDGFMVVTNDKGKTRKSPYRFTGIVVKKDKTWKWRLFNGSMPRGE
jgi:ketosteroid isomerase-like protein